MIVNEVEYIEARRRLQILESSLESLRVQLAEENPALFPTVAPGYLTQIHTLHQEVEGYLQSRTAHVPLFVRLLGKGLDAGKASAKTIGEMLIALQQAVNGEAKQLPEFIEHPKSAIGKVNLNVVATQTGSFIVGLEAADAVQGSLFTEETVTGRALTRVLDKIGHLRAGGLTDADAEQYRTIRELTSILDEDEVTSMEFRYHKAEGQKEVKLDLGEKARLDAIFVQKQASGQTIKGTIISLNIEQNICRIRPVGGSTIRCRYREQIESDIVGAIAKTVIISGDIHEDALGIMQVDTIQNLVVLNESD